MIPKNFANFETKICRIFHHRHLAGRDIRVRLLAVVLILLVPFLASADETEFTLAEQGVGVAPIVIGSDAPPRTKEAANELAIYIEKISGMRPQVFEGIPSELPKQAIWVGYQPQLKKLFPKVDFDFKHPEEIVIIADRNHLVIAGRDRWNPEQNTRVTSKGGTITDYQHEYGTANAVYTFIQDYLNVRWFWPGSTGEDVIKQEAISFPQFEYRYHPQLRGRALFRLSALGDSRGRSQEWVRLQRLQLDSLQLDAGHAFTEWWGRFHQTHPGYFALQPDGTRSLSAFQNDAKRAPKLVKLCVSNPAVWDQWIADVEATLEKNPHQTIFNASENDSFNRGVCICENCRAWDDPNGVKALITWKGIEKEEVALSDRYVRFWNQLGRKLKERFPDRQLYVQGMAYGNARTKPVTAVPDENVIIMVVANSSVGAPGIRTEHLEYMKQWGETARQIIWRPNLWTRAGAWGIPEISMKNQPEVFRLLADHHGIGVIFDTVWEHWATFGPQYYLMAQLTWNPRLDANKVMNDYYQRAFGPAADEVRQYWEGMERLMDNPVGQPIGLNESFLAHSEELLRRAAEKVSEGPEMYRERVEFVSDGFTVTRLLLDYLRIQYAQIKERKTDLNPELEAAWNKIEEWIAKKPAYAINHRFIEKAKTGPRMEYKRSVKLYLEYLSNLWKKGAAKQGEAVDLDLHDGQF